jgi:hypothetical protein
MRHADIDMDGHPSAHGTKTAPLRRRSRARRGCTRARARLRPHASQWIAPRRRLDDRVAKDRHRRIGERRQHHRIHASSCLPHSYAPFLSRNRLYEDVWQSLASRRFGTMRLRDCGLRRVWNEPDLHVRRRKHGHEHEPNKQGSLYSGIQSHQHMHVGRERLHQVHELDAGSVQHDGNGSFTGRPELCGRHEQFRMHHRTVALGTERRSTGEGRDSPRGARRGNGRRNAVRPGWS